MRSLGACLTRLNQQINVILVIHCSSLSPVINYPLAISENIRHNLQHRLFYFLFGDLSSFFYELHRLLFSLAIILTNPRFTICYYKITIQLSNYRNLTSDMCKISAALSLLIFCNSSTIHVCHNFDFLNILFGHDYYWATLAGATFTSLSFLL